MNPMSSPVPFIWTDFVRNKLKTLQFGSVQLTVNEGRVTEIETAKRSRENLPAPRTGGVQSGNPLSRRSLSSRHEAPATSAGRR
jgi:hypothetical protein